MALFCLMWILLFPRKRSPCAGNIISGTKKLVYQRYIRHNLIRVITAIRNVVHGRRYLPVKRIVLFEGDTDRNHLVTKSVTTVSMPQ